MHMRSLNLFEPYSLKYIYKFGLIIKIVSFSSQLLFSFGCRVIFDISGMFYETMATVCLQMCFSPVTVHSDAHITQQI